MKNSPRRLLLSLVVLVAVAGGAALFARQRSEGNVNGLFGGPEGVRSLAAAQKVEAFRLARHVQRSADEVLPAEFGGAEVLSGPIAVVEDDARLLASILRDPKTYSWDSAKGCKFDPGVAFRFAGGTSITDVVFCFHCDEIQIYRDGKRVGGEDIDNARSRLAAIMKRVFPDDRDIQKL